MPVTDALHTKDLHHELQLTVVRNSIFFFSHALFLWDFFHSFFFVDVSVQVMVQISHLLSFIENDKRNQQQLQMYS